MMMPLIVRLTLALLLFTCPRCAIGSDALTGSPLRSLIAMTVADQRLVAVGARGLIMLSDDAGKTWRQTACPVHATLTAVHFANAKLGWAVGDSGVILHTRDGGKTWAVQLMSALPGRLDHSSMDHKSTNLRAALGRTGPPLLDVHFTDVRNGIVVGALGIAYATADGGMHWRSIKDRLPNPHGHHLYAGRIQGNTISVAGAQGFFARSDDGGASFYRIRTPYTGSIFALATHRNKVVLAGPGNVYLYDAVDKRFTSIPGAPSVTIKSAAILRDNSILLNTLDGKLFTKSSDDATLRLIDASPPGAISCLAQTADGGIKAVGPLGVFRLLSPSPSK